MNDNSSAKTENWLQGLLKAKAKWNFTTCAFANDALEKLWDPDYVAPLRMVRASEWNVGMTVEFVKDIHNIDRKLQGRILEAIRTVMLEPMTCKGDTIKPLTADLKNLWRYRIGDYRLIYRPDVEEKNIVLVSFLSRGDSYSS